MEDEAAAAGTGGTRCTSLGDLRLAMTSMGRRTDGVYPTMYTAASRRLTGLVSSHLVPARAHGVHQHGLQVGGYGDLAFMGAGNPHCRPEQSTSAATALIKEFRVHTFIRRTSGGSEQHRGCFPEQERGALVALPMPEPGGASTPSRMQMFHRRQTWGTAT